MIVFRGSPYTLGSQAPPSQIIFDSAGEKQVEPLLVLNSHFPHSFEVKDLKQVSPLTPFSSVFVDASYHSCTDSQKCLSAWTLIALGPLQMSVYSVE